MDNQPTPPEVTDINIKSISALPEYSSDADQMTISDAKLAAIGVKCKSRLDELKSIRKQSKYEEERLLDFDAYHLIPTKKNLPYAGYPNLACPLPRIGVDTFHANVMFTFGGQQGRFQVLPDFLSKSHMDVAKRAADYMTYVLNYEADTYSALDKADMDANKYNNGYLKARYVTKKVFESREVVTEQMVPEVDPLTGNVTRKTVKRKKNERVPRTVFDGIKIERVDPACIFASPLFDSVEEAVEKDYFFEVSNYNMRFVEEQAIAPEYEEPFFIPSKVKQLKTLRRVSIISRLELEKQKYDGVMVDRELELTPIELAEGHFHEDIDGDGLAEKVAVVFETSTGLVLRASFAACRIVKLTPRPVDGRWDGESIRKVVEPLKVEWEAIHNQRVAKGQWSNLPFFFYKAGGRFNPQITTLMPGKGYPVDDPASINFPQPPPPDQSYFAEEKLIMELVDRVLGLGDVIQGVQGGGDQSATNTIQSVQRAGIRLASPINRIAIALEKLLGHIWELTKECAPKIKEFRVAGVGDGTPVFDKITSRDYETQVAFKLNVATLYDVQMVRDTALLNYKTFISNPIFMSNPASFYQLTQDTMNAVGMKIKLPQPDQAKAMSPFEVLDLLSAGREVTEPMPGIDADEYMKAFMAFMNSDEFKDLPRDKQLAVMLYYDKVQILKHTLEAANLNKSGVFEGMNGMQQTPQAPMTATNNPSQTFNRLRVEESPKSQKQNVQNGLTGSQY